MSPVSPIATDLRSLSDAALIRLRADLETEMIRRGKAFSVGDIGEALVTEFFKATSGLPVLLKAPGGTKNVDCLSRDGERYSVKTFCRAKKQAPSIPEGARLLCVKGAQIAFTPRPRRPDCRGNMEVKQPQP